MKWLLILSSAGMFPIFAADSIAPYPWSTWMQGGAAVILAGLFIYVIVWRDPKQRQEEAKALEKRDAAFLAALESNRKEFRESLATQQANFTGTLDKMGERHERWEAQRHTDSEKIAEAINAMTVNCAQTRSAVLARDAK